MVSTLTSALSARTAYMVEIVRNSGVLSELTNTKSPQVTEPSVGSLALPEIRGFSAELRTIYESHIAEARKAASLHLVSSSLSSIDLSQASLPSSQIVSPEPDRLLANAHFGELTGSVAAEARTTLTTLSSELAPFSELTFSFDRSTYSPGEYKLGTVAALSPADSQPLSFPFAKNDVVAEFLSSDTAPQSLLRAA